MEHHYCHIEKLPEDILLHILQSLPLVDAAATRPLSRKWKKLWEKSCSRHSNLCFDVDNLIALNMPAPKCPKESQYLNYRKNLALRGDVYLGMSTEIIDDFVKGVDMIMQGRRSERQDIVLEVKSLEIRFPLCGKHSNHIDNWISSTVTSTTKELILVFNIRSNLPYSYTHSDLYKFPFEVLQNQKNLTLEHLQLEFFSAKLPQNFDGFPNLRTLKLNWSDLTQEDVQKMLINCPLLEFLEIQKCQKLVALQVSSPLPHLKVLILQDCHYLTRIDLWAQNLSSFHYDTAADMDHLFLGGCRNLTKVAARRLHHIDGDVFRPLSNEFPFVSTLYLDSRLNALNVALRNTIFAHLKLLTLFLNFEEDERNLQNLSSLLNVVAPMLEELELHVHKFSPAECFATNNQRIDGDHYNHLKRVAFTGFTGETGQTMLAKYFLMKARKLQVMTIDTRCKFYHNFEAVEHYRFPRDIDEICKNAYEFLCKEVPENAKLILVADN